MAGACGWDEQRTPACAGKADRKFVGGCEQGQRKLHWPICQLRPGNAYSMVSTVPHSTASTTPGMLGYMFWGGGCQGNGTVCTYPPDTCQVLRGWNLAQREQKAPDKSSEPVVMRVGERRISVAELCTAIAQLPPPQRKGYALHPGLAKDWYGPLVALVEEAKRRHLEAGENPKRSEVDRDDALVGELIQSIAKESEPSNREIEHHYVRHKAEFEQARVRHILVSDATALASRSQRSARKPKLEPKKLRRNSRAGRISLN
jgi:hypothetical protein